jgi:two-component system cell cycle response regulator
MVLDELRLRGQSSIEFGITSPQYIEINNPNILVVDDDVVQSKHINTKLMELAGANVSVTNDHKQAIEQLTSTPYDLVIVSTQLSDYDGLRLCSQLRSSENGRHIPTLIMVDEEDRNLVVKGLDIGVSDYIIIPLEGNELLARAKTQIKRKRYQDALRDGLKIIQKELPEIK